MLMQKMELGTALLAADKVGNKFGIKMLLGDGDVGDSSSDRSKRACSPISD